jgi:hypothetical protein
MLSVESNYGARNKLILDAGPWKLDKNSIFIQYLESSIRYRSASSNGLLAQATCWFEAELR